MISGKPQTTRPSLATWVCLCTCVVLPWDSHAEEQPLTIAQLSAALTQSNATTVRFSEERRLQYLTEPLIVEGSFTFEPPGRLERLVLRPKWERMVIEGDLLTLEKAASDPPTRLLLSDYPALDAVISAQRSLFSGDLEKLQRLFDVSLDTHNGVWLLYLVPRGDVMKEAVREVQIGGKGRDVLSITLVETSGDIAVVTILGPP